MSRQETSKQDVPKMKIVVGGVKALMVSQLSTRLLSFSLNLIVARMLTPEEFGLVAVKFHLFNTTILLLSREGLRRGCLVSSGASTEAAAGVMPTAVLVLPVGLAITLIVSASCWLLGEQAAGSQSLIAIQGAAACAELLGEPLYILAQSRMQFWLRVGIEAAAQAAKAAATVVLLLLRPASCTAGEALSAAQLLYGLAVSLGYAWAFRRELPGLAAAALSGPRASEETRRSAELSLGFSVQALEKLVLAEGSKFVMAALESSHNQGIYGMVSNLGSLFVRLVLQPLEESLRRSPRAPRMCAARPPAAGARRPGSSLRPCTASSGPPRWSAAWWRPSARRTPTRRCASCTAAGGRTLRRRLPSALTPCLSPSSRSTASARRSPTPLGTRGSFGPPTEPFWRSVLHTWGSASSSARRPARTGSLPQTLWGC
uniref:Protein RFT1 homolog n=1 Tax=Tetraselmis sp. GSL018 TaxID=582737 RepID=A0A061RV34_9CHLO